MRAGFSEKTAAAFGLFAKSDAEFRCFTQIDEQSLGEKAPLNPQLCDAPVAPARRTACASAKAHLNLPADSRA